MKQENRKDRLVFVVLLLAILLRGICYFQNVSFTFRSDDFGPLIYPAALAGHDWRSLVSSFTHYYGFGFSWLYTPLFWLFSDGEKIMIGIAVMKSVFIVLCSGYIYWLEKRYLKIESDVLRVLLAVVPSLFTGDVGLMHGGSLWYHSDNEIPVYLVVWILTGLLLAVHELEEKLRMELLAAAEQKKIWYRKRMILSAAVALVLAWSLMIHERAMGMVLAIFMAEFLIWMLRGNWIMQPVVFTGTFAVGFVLQRFIRRAVIAYMWSGGHPGHNVSAFTKVSLDFLTSYVQFKSLVILVVGNFHSLLVKGYGLPIIAMVGVTIWVFAALIRLINKKSMFGNGVLGDRMIDPEMLLMLTWGGCILVIIGGLGVRWSGKLAAGLDKVKAVNAYKGICYSRYYFPWMGVILVAVVAYIYKKRDAIRSYLWLCWLAMAGIEGFFMWKILPYCKKKNSSGSNYVRRALSFKLFSSKSNVFNLKICIAVMFLVLLLVTIYVCKIRLAGYVKEICLWAVLVLMILTIGQTRVEQVQNHGKQPGFSLGQNAVEPSKKLRTLLESGTELGDVIYLDLKARKYEYVIQLNNLDGKFKRGLPSTDRLSEKNVIVSSKNNKKLEEKGYVGIPSGKLIIYTNDNACEKILAE